MFNYFDIDQQIVLDIKRFEKDELADLGIISIVALAALR